MSLKWIFALLILVYSFNSFSSEMQFAQMIEENQRDQIKLATELRAYLGMTQEKTLKNLTASDTVSLEGFNIQIYR